MSGDDDFLSMNGNTTISKTRRRFLRASAAAIVAIAAGIGGYFMFQFNRQSPSLSTATTVLSSPASPGPNAPGFSLSSNAFGNGERISVEFTCDGQNVSPPLSWSGAPPTTKTFTLVVDDLDAPGGVFTHWILYNIPNTVTALPTGMKKQTSIDNIGFQGQNDFGEVGYGCPCPPPGRPHRYRFRIYALDASFGRVVTKDTVLRAIEPYPRHG